MVGWRWEHRRAGPRLLRAFADAYPRAQFVEIGSNDGEQHDHLRPFILDRDWRGVMVEPVPYVFARLEANYRGVAGVALENAAIADRDGTLPFYHLVDASDEARRDLPDWYDGIGSFSREAVLSHAAHMPDVEERIVTAQVPALSFDSLCRKHGLGTVNLVLIDTEGYDSAIVRSIDFDVWRPELLVYEHYHLSADERSAAAEHVRGQGYETMEEGFDTFCLRAGADERLRRTWRRLTPAVPGRAKYEEAAV
jgi:FkbM family methyltransferase